MQIQTLYPYLVPLTFLAIWALTSLFNREAQPLPPRVGRPSGPPSGVPGRVAAPNKTRPVQRPPSRADDDLVIIETDKRRASSGALARPTARRQAKPRANTSAGLSNVETTSRALTDPLDGPTSPSMAYPKGLTPLSLPPSPLNAPSTLAGTKTELIAAGTLDVHPLSADQAWELLRSPQRLREALVMSEILKPPKAMSRGPFRKR